MRPDSAGLLLGLGVFTTIGIWDGRAFAVDRHFDRMSADAAALELECAYALEEINVVLERLITATGLERGIARLTLTARGDGRWSLEQGSDLSILVLPATDAARPARLGWSPFRIDARRPAAGIKSTSYADYWLAWRDAQRRGLDDAVLCSSSGALCEAARANLFWTCGGSLFTPSLDSGCLPGIGRALILEWALADGIPVREAAYAPSELSAADAIFLSGAASGVRPAVMPDPAGGQDALNGTSETCTNENAAPDAVIEHLRRRWEEAVLRS